MIEIIEYNTECYKFDNGMTITIDYGEKDKGEYVPSIVDPVPILEFPKFNHQYMRIQLFDKKEKVKGSLIQLNKYYFLTDHIERKVYNDKDLQSKFNTFRDYQNSINEYISSNDILKKCVDGLYNFVLDNGMTITIAYGELDKLTSEFSKDTVNKLSYSCNPHYKISLFDKKNKLIAETILVNPGYISLDTPMKREDDDSDGGIII
ncbi:MAG: hypothetical protein MJ224_07180 [archaeon]|nr:hypothetical protein [archaeon]